jgi:spore coat protein U-like protein
MISKAHRLQRKLSVVGAVIALVSSVVDARATTTTTTFTVQMTIIASCTIVSASSLNFGGSQGVLTANVDQSSTIQVQCTNTTPYKIGLDAGTGAGATVAARKMTSGGATITYSLYTDSGRTTVWGNTVGTDTVSATGNGSAQSTTVFGRVPPQTTPAPGTYTDTITVTVTY